MVSEISSYLNIYSSELVDAGVPQPSPKALEDEFVRRVWSCLVGLLPGFDTDTQHAPWCRKALGGGLECV